MKKNSHFTLEKLLKQNKQRMYYYAYQYNMKLHTWHDPKQFVVLWNRKKYYEVNNYPLATYFNHFIHLYIKNQKHLTNYHQNRRKTTV